MIEYSAVQRVALPIFNVALLLSFSSVLYGQAATSKDEYATATAKWRQQREKELRWEFGPLYIIGSYEVQERPMQVGSATDNDIVLPDRAPKHAGFFTCIKNEIRFQPEERIAIQLNGKAAAGAVKLKPGQPFAADKLRIGDFTFIGWVGNDQCKVSVRDVQSEYYRNFHGLDWYPIQPTYRVE